MEKTNYDFLCEDLKFLGFGETLKDALEEAMDENPSSFELAFSHTINGENIHAILYFEKPDPLGYFFFTKYEMVLRDSHHQFTIFKGKAITVKEGYNLLCGRAVFKQLVAKNNQKYNAWLQLDLNVRENEGFKVNTYHESYGYDLSAALNEFSIETPSSNWDRAMLLRSLQKGNLQAAFLKVNGENRKVLMEANPKGKNVIIHKEIFPTEQQVRWPVPVEESHTAGDDIENVFRKKNLKAKRLKEI
jgi:hypothetical protein